MEKLHGWIFQYNNYTKEWECCKREDFFELNNNRDSEKVFRTKKDIDTLFYLINRTEGKKEKIETLIS